MGENSPSEPVISQYPLEDILDKFYVYLHDDYVDENTSDTINSYVEFASEDIEDIRAVLSILGNMFIMLMKVTISISRLNQYRTEL